MTRWIEVEKARTFYRHDVPSVVNLTSRTTNLRFAVPVLNNGPDPTLTSEVQFCVFADHFTLPGQHHREWTRDEREVGLTRPANKPPVPIKNNLKNAVMPEKSQSSLPLPVPLHSRAHTDCSDCFW